MNSNHSKLDVIWTLDEIGGDMHLMGIYDIWPYWVDHQEPINILMWISPAIFFTHIYLQNFCRYALTTTHNDMGLLQNSMPHSIQYSHQISPQNLSIFQEIRIPKPPVKCHSARCQRLWKRLRSPQTRWPGKGDLIRKNRYCSSVRNLDPPEESLIFTFFLWMANRWDRCLPVPQIGQSICHRRQRIRSCADFDARPTATWSFWKNGDSHLCKIVKNMIKSSFFTKYITITGYYASFMFPWYNGYVNPQNSARQPAISAHACIAIDAALITLQNSRCSTI